MRGFPGQPDAPKQLVPDTSAQKGPETGDSP